MTVAAFLTWGSLTPVESAVAVESGSFYLAGRPWVGVAGQLCLQIASSLRNGLHLERGSHHEPSGKAPLLSHPVLGNPRGRYHVPGPPPCIVSGTSVATW